MKNERQDGGGYVRLYRKLMTNAIWTSSEPHNERSAWVHILMSVRWHSEPVQTMINGRILEVSRGESVKSLDTWARELNWSKSKVRRYFDKLKKLNQIDTRNEHKTTRLTVCNFDSYQDLRHVTDTQNNTIPSTVPTRNRHVTDTMPTPEEEGKNSMNREEGEVCPPAAAGLLKMFQAAHPSCVRIGQHEFDAAIMACSTTAGLPDVKEAIEAFTIEMAGASLQFPMREFKKFLRHSGRRLMEDEVRKKKKAAAAAVLKEVSGGDSEPKRYKPELNRSM